MACLVWCFFFVQTLDAIVFTYLAYGLLCQALRAAVTYQQGFLAKKANAEMVAFRGQAFISQSD